MIVAMMMGAGLGWLVTWATRHYVHKYRNSLPHPPSSALYRWIESPTKWWASALFGIGTAFWWQMHPTWSESLPVMVVVTILAIITLVDLAVRRIPNQLVLTLFIWAIIQSLWTGHPSLEGLSLGTLIGGGLFLLIALAGRGALGMGDVKLAAALGAVLGYPAIIHALFVGIVAGGVGALSLILMRRISRKDYIAYGPYLALGAILVLIQ